MALQNELEAGQVLELSNEKLAERYLELDYQKKDLDAELLVIKGEILARLKNDAEVWGETSVTKVKRASYAKVSLETARELGAVKETVDSAMLGKLRKKGVEILGMKETEYILVKPLNKEE